MCISVDYKFNEHNLHNFYVYIIYYPMFSAIHLGKTKKKRQIDGIKNLSRNSPTFSQIGWKIREKY